MAALAAILSLGLIPSAKAQVKSEGYPVPLWFDVLGDGVEILPLQFVYDLERTGGKTLELGPLFFDGREFSVLVMPLKRAEPRANLQNSNEWVFLLNWPAHLLRDGKLEMISRRGQVLWSKQIDPIEIRSWSESLDPIREQIRRNQSMPSELNRSLLMQAQYGIRNFKESSQPFWKLNEPVKFCMTHQVTEGMTRLCTNLYEGLQEKGNFSFLPLKFTPQPPRIIIQNNDGKLKDQIEVQPGQPFQFYAEVANGSTFEFVAVPQKFELMEMTWGKDRQTANVIGEGLRPLQPWQSSDRKPISRWVEFFRWQPTIGDLREFWKTEIQIQNPIIPVPGLGGGVFMQPFQITKLPSEEARPYLSDRTPEGSYVDGVKLFGRKRKGTRVLSKQNSIEIEKETPDDFMWRFGMPQKGFKNRSYTSVIDGRETFKAYHELYKGYSAELSTRLIAVLGTEPNEQLAIGEMAFSYWFEDLFGWSEYWISRQRWGINAKYNTSLSPLSRKTESSLSKVLPVKDNEVKEPFSYATMDLKYRFTPGLWGRDETWGVMASAQSVTYTEFSANLFGFGAFWARSMPKGFDDLMNLLPFLNHPKWVDFELIYYPVSTTPNITALGPAGGRSKKSAGNWALNFHGKVMWSQSFFGEAGFGFRSYGISRRFSDTSATVSDFNFTSLYGTLGIGINF